MRFLWTALVCGTLFGCGRVCAAPAGSVRLDECRLEHPLRLSSVAVHCAVLEVPENPADPAGAQIGLYVAVVPALNLRSTAAPLFILAGGPGQAASDLYASYAGAFARVNRSHAIVVVDQRGTGRSAPLNCHYPDDWLSGADTVAELRRSTEACLAQFGDRARYYTTSLAVADLERVRQALGFQRIDLYGSSYGTRVAQLYMRHHPGTTEAAILDGVTYPQQIIGPDTPADGERALNLIVERCERESACAAAYPALRRELAGLRQRFGPERQALTLTDPSDAAPLAVEFNRSMLNAALRLMSYTSTQAALLPTLVHEAAGGNLQPLAAQVLMLSRQVVTQLASGMQNSVICSEDAPRFALSAAARRRIALTYQGIDQIEAVEEICKVWPRGPVDGDLHAALDSEVPTLLLSGEADPVTPPEDAIRAALHLAHHRLLTLNGEGHGQLATGCVPALMAAFLDAPVPERLDAQCLARHRPTAFFVGMTGPAP